MEDLWVDSSKHDTFLAACCNLHSIKQNGLLFLHGFINHEIKDNNLYKIVPSSIIELILMVFCYDFLKLVRMSNKNTSDEWCARRKSYEMGKAQILSKIAKFEESHAWESKTIVDIFTMRRIWRLKIIKSNIATYASFEFKIAITNNQDLTGNYEIDISNGSVESSGIKISNYDIISVVYVQRERISNYQWNGRIRFYVNDILCPIQYDTDAMFFSDSYKLVVKLYEFVQIEMV
eukprot:UN10979